jgi:hypothetical protein
MRQAGYLLGITFVCVSFFLPSFTHAEVVTSHTFRQWGEDLMAVIQSTYGRSDGLYRHSTTQTFADYAWGQGIMSTALTAAAKLDSSYVERATRQADTFHLRYWCTQNGTSGYNASYGNCGDRYYDDNAWIALALLELYEITGNEKYLTWARETTAFSMTGENGPGDNPPGGIRWHESNTGGASICSTAPTCLANLMIYHLTGIESYLVDGLRLYNWLITSTTYRYSNGIFHEMNQGPLGYQTAVVTQCAVLLYRITGNTTYLSEAQYMAKAMEKEFISSTTFRLNQHGKWGGHDMTNAYVDLYEVDGNPRWLNIAVGYLVYLRDNGYDPVTGRYPAVWNSTEVASGLIDNASVARAFWRMATAPGGTVPVNDYVFIRNRNSGRALRIHNNILADNTNVVLFDYNTTYVSQRWTLMDLGNGYFTLRSWNTSNVDKLIQPFNNGTANNTNSVIFEANPAQHAQQWSFIDLGNGYFNIQNRLSGTSLQPLNNGTANNTNVVINTPNLSSQSQQWQIVGSYAPTSVIPYISIGGDWVQTERVVLDAGDTVSLKAQVSGNGACRWEGPNGFSATGSEITLSNILPRQAGYYVAIFTNANNIESFCAIRVTVNAAVTLYQHLNYGGWAASFGVGAYTAADIIAAGGLNNDATSLKIVPGYKVTFYDYDNFQGPSLVKTANDTSFVDDGWNDRVTSMIIEGEPAPLAHWQFNDNSGSVLSDISGNGRNGQLMNMAPSNWTGGKHCGGLYFDGVNDYVEIPGFKGISGGTSRTCMAWIKTTISSKQVLSWGASNPGTKWVIRINEDGTLRTEVQGGYIFGRTKITDGHWHHIAVVLDNDEVPNICKVQLYVDGQLETTGGIQAFPIYTATADNVKIGVHSVGLGYFSGLIDEVRIYDKPLSAERIHNIYREQALIADLDTDGIVDLNDFAAFSEFWQNTDTCDGDLTCDCIVDIQDVMILVEEWLQSI